MAKKDEEKRSGGFGYTDDSGNRVSAFRDMFDGGGAGRSGASFEGSPLSTFGNALGMRPSGSDRPNPRQSAGFGDFFDGGGYGRSGQRFSGSNYSILANALGIKPMGYEQRLAAAQAQAQAAPAVGYAAVDPTPQYDPMYTDMNYRKAAGLLPMFEYGPSYTSDNYEEASGVNLQVPMQSGFDAYVAGLGPAAEGMSQRALEYAYELHLQGYGQ